MRTKSLTLALTAFMLTVLSAVPPVARAQAGTGDASQIFEEAFIYGFPMVMNYGVFYQYFVDKSSPEYKAPFNILYNSAHVYTPKDTAVVTPNSDTPYSFVAMDLRAEPFVICNPEIEKSRYFSVQLVDFYTFNYGYMGSRTTGNSAECNMVAGPRWKGEKPAGVANVFHSETDFSFAIIRTQLFNAADLDNVKKIQDGYRAGTLSQFEHKPAPPAAAKIKWPMIDKKVAAANFFGYLDFLLRFCPPTGPAAVEVPLRARFASVGIQAGQPFDAARLTPEQKVTLKTAMEAGLTKIKQQVASLGHDVNGWRVFTSGFGDRQQYNGDWTLRAAAAMAGIYGNSPAEAMYPLLSTDNDGNKPDCSKNRYTLTFPAGQLPPVNAFWSVTMYNAATQLLINNPINRYLINSPMLGNLKENADGSLTLYIQKDSPGKDKEPNWLPAPDGPIYVAMRLYWPKEAALKGDWKPPPVVLVK